MSAKYHRVQADDDSSSELVDRNANNITDDSIELGESVPPAYSNSNYNSTGEPALLTDAEIRKRLPPADGSNADVRAFIQLLLQNRGESYHLVSDDLPPVASSDDIRYLTAADLYTLKEEELVDVFPPTWPPQLQKLVAKDVKRFTDWVSRLGFE